MQITVTKLEEAGYQSAMLGLSLNKNQPLDKMSTVAYNLSDKDKGHNKCLEHIYIWLLVDAPRYWWAEADTFRISSKQSASTIHTILKKPLTEDDFEDKEITPFVLNDLNSYIVTKSLLKLKQNLPEGFMQKREWCMSYKTLANIIDQRKHHVLPHWQEFIKQTVSQLDHSELLEKKLK